MEKLPEPAKDIAQLEYQNLFFSEVLINAIHGVIKSFRLTSRSVGDLFGARFSRVYLSKLKQRYPDLPSGVEVTVTSTDGKAYLTKTFDIHEIYRYAIRSELPGARAFLERYPEFMKALQSGKLKAPAPCLEKLAELPKWTHGTGKEINRIAQEKKVHPATIRRQMARHSAGEPIKKTRPPESYVRRKSIPLIVNAYRIYCELKKKGNWIDMKEFSKLTDVPEPTLYGWKNRYFTEEFIYKLLK